MRFEHVVDMVMSQVEETQLSVANVYTLSERAVNGLGPDLFESVIIDMIRTNRSLKSDFTPAPFGKSADFFVELLINEVSREVALNPRVKQILKGALDAT